MTDKQQPALLARLQKSNDNRTAMLNKFGFIPHSLLKLSRGPLSKSLFNFGGELGRTTARGKRAFQGGVFDSARLRPSGGGSRGRISVSVMPAELVQFFISYYASPGAVYLDPFMGQGVQMQVAYRNGLHYYGYDSCKEYCDYIEAVKQLITTGGTDFNGTPRTQTIQTTHGDSRHPDNIPDGIGDFSFHSPPYWDIEFYDDNPAQLGYHHTYPEFLAGLGEVAAAWLPKFKSGAYHVVNISDFRKDGKFYPYHMDPARMFSEAGWLLTDIWIVEGLVAGLPKTFAVDFNQRRIAPKVHEYALVFQKV